MHNHSELDLVTCRLRVRKGTKLGNFVPFLKWGILEGGLCDLEVLNRPGRPLTRPFKFGPEILVKIS